MIRKTIGIAFVLALTVSATGEEKFGKGVTLTGVGPYPILL